MISTARFDRFLFRSVCRATRRPGPMVALPNSRSAEEGRWQSESDRPDTAPGRWEARLFRDLAHGKTDSLHS